MTANDIKTSMGDESSKIRELIRLHKICWEIWPEYHVDRDGKKVQIGFELDLIGTHYHPEHTPEPGCAECVKVYDDLKRVAQWIIPEEKRDCPYQIEGFDSSIHYASQRKNRKDIALTIKILHGEAFDRPMDASQIECLNEMKEKVKEVGAHEGYWLESTE